MTRRLGPRQKACLLAAAFGIALGFLPLFGGPGYEIALAYGVLLPGTAAVASAQGGFARTPTRGLWEGLTTGAWVFGSGLLASLLHLLRAPACEPLGGAGYMLLSAGVGTLLGGLWGGAVRELARPAVLRRRGLRVLAALCLPIGGMLISLLRFYGSPIIFAYDPFVGYFSGTLYDTIVEPGATLWLYRAGSACTIVGVLLASLALTRRGDHPAALPRLRLRGRGAERLGLVALGFALLSVSIGMWLWSDRFDFTHDAASIARGLGGRIEGPRCSVLFPRTLEQREAELLLRDCEEQLADVERALGARGPDRLTAFFFRDAAEKKRFMGAAHTYIAKPWRAEVYLQTASYPHPVLGHEIAHVVAAGFGRGPFRIAGRVGGLLPDPGLIEGVATATSPDDDALTDLEWCKAMKDENLLPEVGSLFSLSFLGHSSSRAYTVAGAFVGYVRDRFGAATVRSWYSGSDLPALTERSWRTLESEFGAHLDTIELPPASRAYARAKFGKPGVFGRRCPHVLDRLRGEGERCAREHDLRAAAQAFEAALALDPSDSRTRLGVAALAAARGDLAEAQTRYESLLEEPSAQVRERARDQLGDLWLLQGAYAEAAAMFEGIVQDSEDEDLVRSAEVKGLAAQDPLLRASLVTLLVGLPPAGQKVPLLAGALLGEARAASPRAAGLASYLIGKHLVAQGAHEHAMPWLRSAASARAELGPRVGRELSRQLAIAACVTGARDVLEQVEHELERAGATSSGRTAAIWRLIRRCRAPGP